MSAGRINSEESIRTAKRMLRAFNGSWSAVERAASVDEDGVYVVRLPREARPSGMASPPADT